MAYENVNVTQLKKSINDCKNSINYRKEQEIFTEISRGNVWDCSAKTTLEVAINNLINKRLTQINSIFDTMLIMADRIAEYQNYQKLKKETEDQITELNKNYQLNLIDRTYYFSEKMRLTNQKNQYRSQMQMANTLINNQYNSFYTILTKNNFI